MHFDLECMVQLEQDVGCTRAVCVTAPLLLLTLLTIYGSCVEEVDLSRFTSSLVDLANME